MMITRHLMPDSFKASARSSSARFWSGSSELETMMAGSFAPCEEIDRNSTS